MLILCMETEQAIILNLFSRNIILVVLLSRTVAVVVIVVLVVVVVVGAIVVMGRFKGEMRR